MGAGAVVKYADEIVELGNDVIETAYGTGVKSIDFDDGFKGFNLDESSDFFKSSDEVVEGDSLTLAQYGDDFGKMGTYVENPNIKLD